VLRQPEEVTLHDGRYEYRFVCRTKKERNRARRLLSKERGTIAWIDRHLRAGDVFYDIGANIGAYTIFAGHRLGDSGQVIAFEPHIPNANSLIENVFANGLDRRVTIVTAALSREPGYERFNYYAMQAGTSSSQYGRASVDGQSFEPRFAEIKHGCTVDALCDRGLIRPPDLVKIDVDGLEIDVLEGMRHVLAAPNGPRSVQVELIAQNATRVEEFMAACGFAVVDRQWSDSALGHIANGQQRETLPHNAVFMREAQVGREVTA
jgi:FkbM family methyltransferase